MNTLTPTQEDIAVRAYHLFLEGGCQHGRDLEYWFQAEKDIGIRFFTPPAEKKAVKIAKKPATKKTPVVAAVVAEAPKLAKKPVAKKAAVADAPAKKVVKKKA